MWIGRGRHSWRPHRNLIVYREETKDSTHTCLPFYHGHISECRAPPGGQDKNCLDGSGK